MRKRYYIENADDYVGIEVTLEGWLAGKRSSGKILFLQLRDGTGFIQCVASRGDIGDEAFDAADELTQESSLRITGTLSQDERAPGGYAVSVSAIEIVHVAVEYPIPR